MQAVLHTAPTSFHPFCPPASHIPHPLARCRCWRRATRGRSVGWGGGRLVLLLPRARPACYLRLLPLLVEMVTALAAAVLACCSCMLLVLCCCLPGACWWCLLAACVSAVCMLAVVRCRCLLQWLSLLACSGCFRGLLLLRCAGCHGGCCRCCFLAEAVSAACCCSLMFVAAVAAAACLLQLLWLMAAAAGCSFSCSLLLRADSLTP